MYIRNFWKKKLKESLRLKKFMQMGVNLRLSEGGFACCYP